MKQPREREKEKERVSLAPAAPPSSAAAGGPSPSPPLPSQPTSLAAPRSALARTRAKQPPHTPHTAATARQPQCRGSARWLRCLAHPHTCPRTSPPPQWNTRLRIRAAARAL
eukprot:2416636-Rhodomonas_salina.2